MAAWTSVPARMVDAETHEISAKAKSHNKSTVQISVLPHPCKDHDHFIFVSRLDHYFQHQVLTRREIAEVVLLRIGLLKPVPE